MPWKITEPMDQKIQLIAQWQQEQYSITDLSKKYGVSRKTVYKWCLRYGKQGIDGLKDRIEHPNTALTKQPRIFLGQSLTKSSRTVSAGLKRYTIS